MTRRCTPLGFCQSRKPACEGCVWKLAPGVIDGPYRRSFRGLSADQAAAIGRSALILAFLAALSLTLGFAAGYLNLLELFR